MAKTFAFRISLADMIRKLTCQYENPLDYVHNLVSELYERGRAFDISLTPEAIEIRTPAALGREFFDSAESAGVVSLSHLLPPTKAYETVEVASSHNRSLTIDASRNITVLHRAENPVDAQTQEMISSEGSSLQGTVSQGTTSQGTSLEGTIIRISRQQQDKKAIKEEESRLKLLYGGSDLDVSINGTSLRKNNPVSTDFQAQGFSGVIRYNPNSRGGIHYYSRGRYISSEPFANGIDISLYEHPFNTTITKSRVITRGRARQEYESLTRQLPGIVAGLLESGAVKELRRKSELSYQALLRSALIRYQDDAGILDIVRRNIIFSAWNYKYAPSMTLENVCNNSIELPYSEERIYRILTGQKRQFGQQKARPSRRKSLAIGLAILLVGVGSKSVNYHHESAVTVDETSAQTDAQATGQYSRSGSGFGLHDAAFDDSMTVGMDSITPRTITGYKISKIEKGKLSSGRSERVGALTKHQLMSALSTNVEGAPSGYVKEDAMNRVFMQNGKVYWGVDATTDGLNVQGIHVAVPTDISRVASGSSCPAVKLKAVEDYITGEFQYGAVDEEALKRYRNDLDAMINEKTVICSSANTYGALLLHELGFNKVHYVGGLLDGGFHAWLEVNLDGNWYNFDCTPISHDPDLNALVINSANASGGSPNIIIANNSSNGSNINGAGGPALPGSIGAGAEKQAEDWKKYARKKYAALPSYHSFGEQIWSIFHRPEGVRITPGGSGGSGTKQIYTGGPIQTGSQSESNGASHSSSSSNSGNSGGTTPRYAIDGKPCSFFRYYSSDPRFAVEDTVDAIRSGLSLPEAAADQIIEVIRDPSYIDFSLDGATDNDFAGLCFILLDLAIAGASIYYGARGAAITAGKIAQKASLKSRNPLDYVLNPERPYQVETVVVRDLLGVRNISSYEGDSIRYDARKKALYIPEVYFAAKSPVQIAQEALPLLPMPDKLRAAAMKRIYRV